jgi:hypothetical protein
LGITAWRDDSGRSAIGDGIMAPVRFACLIC